MKVKAVAVVAAVTLVGGAPALAQDGHAGDGVRSEAGAREVAEPAPRLVVADGVRAKAAVVDLARARVLTRVRLGSVGSLADAGDGRHVLAVQPALDRVKVIDGGSWSVPHGDHSHHYVRAPRGRLTITGKRPVHVIAHGSRVAIFNDGLGSASILRSSRLMHRRAAVRVVSDTPHHGVAVPVGNRTLISVMAPSTGDELPSSVALANAKGRLGGQRLTCRELHGEGSVDATAVLFACADGYLLARAGRGLQGVTIPLPAGLAEGERSFTVSTAEGLRRAIGDLDATRLVSIDLAARTSAVIPVPGRRGAFVLDPDSRSVLVVTDDGVLHQLDPATGAVRASVPAVTPFSLAGGFSVPRPKLALGPDRRVYLSDPAGHRVVEVATNPLRVARQIRVGGTPNSLVVVGAGGGH